VASALSQKAPRLRAELAVLEKALEDDASQSRLDTALSLVNRDLTDYARQLGLEHGNNPLRLDLKNLTIVADTIDGPLALSQMGSGEWSGITLPPTSACIGSLLCENVRCPPS
jgi:Protein of unknown function (DUF3732)